MRPLFKYTYLHFKLKNNKSYCVKGYISSQKSKTSHCTRVVVRPRSHKFLLLPYIFLFITFQFELGIIWIPSPKISDSFTVLPWASKNITNLCLNQFSCNDLAQFKISNDKNLFQLWDDLFMPKMPPTFYTSQFNYLI